MAALTDVKQSDLQVGPCEQTEARNFRNRLIGQDFTLRCPYLVLAAVACLAAYWQNSLIWILHRSLRHMGISDLEAPGVFVLAMSYGYLLYVLPVVLLLAYFVCSRLRILQKPLAVAFIASALLLIFLFVAFLMVTPFWPCCIEIEPG